MKEEFIHYLWRYRLLLPELTTVLGENICVIQTGRPNPDSGPDFFNALILIGNTTWAGNVEIHVRASEWFDHCHHLDPAYDNVILHVVYDCNSSVYRRDSSLLPTLEIKNKFETDRLLNYNQLLLSMNWIPCEDQIKYIDAERLNLFLEKLLVERLLRKTKLLEGLFSTSANNLEELLYQQIAAGFGLKVNAEAFSFLARSTPLRFLVRYQESSTFLEAILFGQAGMLNKEFQEDYPQQLKEIYDYLQKLYGLKPINESYWKFLRMRPVIFPTIRLSQFATLISKKPNIISAFYDNPELEKWRSLLTLKTSEYWEEHFLFEKLSPKVEKRIGKESINSIIINELIPFYFFASKKNGDIDAVDHALNMFSEVEFEVNTITKSWMKLGLSISSAAASQSLIELKHSYCDNKKCLECSIGHILLKEQKRPIEIEDNL
jgi:hypothetical protein